VKAIGNALPDDAVLLVTGASTGLGLALAKRLLRKTRYRLVLTSRASSLSRFASEGITAGPRVRLQELDVADAASRAAAIAAVETEWGGVEILVNNAGIATRAVTEHISEADIHRIMAVNFFGPLDLIRRVLPGMRARRRGRIVTVSSVGGMMAMPTMSAYSASKFAIEGACESLWYEIRPWGVGVSLVEPGFINSDSFTHTLHTRRSARALGDDDDPYHAHYEAMAGMIERLMRRTWATPEHVAGRIIRTIRARDPRLRVRATPDALVFDYLRRWLPRRLYHAVLHAALPNVRRWGPGRRAP
jgi:Short-chain dehydrogenases of various substrate specificities